MVPTVFAEALARARAAARPVVAVQGLGFVGAAVAAVLAEARDSAGRPAFTVVGVDLDSPAGLRRIQAINEGRSPIAAPDPQLAAFIQRGFEEGNLCATTSERAFSEATVIVVDLPLDVANRTAERVADIELDLGSYRKAMRAIGRRMRGDALVVIESTVPVGMTEHVVQPILEEERRCRNISEELLLAHCYERVMPGPRYVDSIRRFWRVFAAINAASHERMRAFLASFVAVEEFPPAELAQPAESELAKIMENSYRAMNIAWIQEWTELAERIGVNLYAVTDAIRVRKGTHDNIRFPGFGVGGYCLTKDAFLAGWGARELFGLKDLELPMTLTALNINFAMPRHAWRVAKEAAEADWRDRVWGVFGVSYLADLDDTRNSPVETLVDAMEDDGARYLLHDPNVQALASRPNAPLEPRLELVCSRIDAIILTIGHREFRAIDFLQLVERYPRIRIIVDAWNLIDDSVAARLVDTGVRVAGVGKGHWRKLNYHR